MFSRALNYIAYFLLQKHCIPTHHMTILLLFHFAFAGEERNVIFQKVSLTSGCSWQALSVSSNIFVSYVRRFLRKENKITA